MLSAFFTTVNPRRCSSVAIVALSSRAIFLSFQRSSGCNIIISQSDFRAQSIESDKSSFFIARDRVALAHHRAQARRTALEARLWSDTLHSASFGQSHSREGTDWVL
jgi:hypothetical protein